MANLINPGRVEVDSEGVYRWTARLGKDYERKGYRLTMIVTGSICLFLVVFSGLLALQYRSIQAFLITLISCVAAMVISGLICFWMDRAPGAAVQAYEMRAEHIRFVTAKSTYLDFKDVKEVLVAKTYVELKRKRISVRVYVPVEDMDLVSGFIMTHVPLGTKIERQNSD